MKKYTITLSILTAIIMSGCTELTIPSPEDVKMRLENTASDTKEIQSEYSQVTGDVIFAIEAKSYNDASQVFNQIKSSLASRSYEGKKSQYMGALGVMNYVDWWDAAFDTYGTTFTYAQRNWDNIIVKYNLKEYNGKYFIYIESSNGSRRSFGKDLFITMLTPPNGRQSSNLNNYGYKKANKILISAINQTGKAIDIRQDTIATKVYRDTWIQGR